MRSILWTAIDDDELALDVIFDRLVRQAGERGSESSEAGIQVESGQLPGCVESASPAKSCRSTDGIFERAVNPSA